MDAINGKMQFEKKDYARFNKNSYPHYILGGDIGGTNTNLGIFGVKNKLPALLASFRFRSRELKGLHYAVNEAVSYAEKNYKIRISKACLAAAGVLSQKKDYAKTQNIRWDVDKNELLKKTKLKKIILINDFEAIGYGISMLAKKDVFTVKNAEKMPKAPILIVGAGSGLGKTALIYNEERKSYIPLPSEAGHMDFPAQSRQELELADFIRKNKKISHSVSYEQVLSGQGLSSIYLFLRNSGKFKKTDYAKAIDKSFFEPELISKYRKTDELCKATFKIFKNIYARFAKNLAIECLAYGGVYIAGGIAAKNRDIFDKEFVRKFEDNHKMGHLLKKIPVYLILNNNAGLYGAGFFGAGHLSKTTLHRRVACRKS